MSKLNMNQEDYLIKWIHMQPNEVADRILVETVCEGMKIKLSKKRNEGRSGWHTSKCSNQYLKQMLMNHIEKGDMIDVINLAGMIYCRELLYSSELECKVEKNETE